MQGKVVLTVALSLIQGVVFSAHGQANQFAEHRVAPSAQYLISGRDRTFAIDYVAQIKDVPTGTRQLRLWIPVPQDSVSQSIRELTFSKPVELTRELRNGNRMAYYEVRDPAQNLELRMHFICIRREVRVDLSHLGSDRAEPAGESAMSWQTNRLVRVTKQIAKISKELTAGKSNTLDKARAMYDYVVSSMRYDKSQPGWGTGNSDFACSKRCGNCTDFHAFFNALCGAQGIGSGFEIGLLLPYQQGTTGAAGAYHCWAYFRVPGRSWVPVDCSEANLHPELKDFLFGSLTSNRVGFSVGRDIDLVPHQAGPALNYFINPYAEADEVPIPTDKSWSYHDLSEN